MNRKKRIKMKKNLNVLEEQVHLQGANLKEKLF